VFVKVGPESFAMRPVRVGGRAGVGPAAPREVLLGLSAGDRVVTVGTYPLRSLAGR
jgi:hypothetical protein